MKWYFKLLPVFLYVYIVRKLQPVSFHMSARDQIWYMPDKDILIRAVKNDRKS